MQNSFASYDFLNVGYSRTGFEIDALEAYFSHSQALTRRRLALAHLLLTSWVCLRADEGYEC